MFSNDVIVSITINGGHPWGFSIKGGSKSNKPLVISKLKKKGKAENAGLWIGDILYRINKLPLSGSLDDAVSLVRQSQFELVLEVQRIHNNESEMFIPDPSTYIITDHQRNNHKTSDDQSYSSYSNDLLQQQRRYDENALRDHDVHSSTLTHSPAPDRKFQFPQDVALNPNNPTLNSFSTDCNPASEEYKDDDALSNLNNEFERPIVKLRTIKARDSGFAVERPRSWHAKSLNIKDSECLYQEDNMRSPESGYTQQAQYRRVAPPTNCHTKEWGESGDLKSVYRPEVSGSKDSLLSSSSQTSSKGAQLSLSSSRSWGTMSSSRGSLDNIDEPASMEGSNEGERYPYTLTTSSKQQYPSPSQPQAGIVSQQRNMFERLCQKSSSTNQYPVSKMSRDSTTRTTRIKSNDSDTGFTSTSNNRSSNSSLSPPIFSGNTKRPTSATSYRSASHSEKENFPFRKRSGEYIDEASYQSEENKKKNFKLSSPNNPNPPVASTNKRVVDFTASSIPQPPLRDESSKKAMKTYYTLPLSSVSQKSLLPDSTQKYDHDRSIETAARPSPPMLIVDTDDDSVASSKRQERVFRVMSVGNNRNVVSSKVTVPSRMKSSHLADTESSQNTNRFEKNLTIRTDSNGITSNNAASNTSYSAIPPGVRTRVQTKHGSTKSIDSNDVRTAGRYGSVWKTPQSKHRRARSSDFSTVLNEWNTTDANFSQHGKLAVFKTNENNPEIDSQNSLAIDPYVNQPSDLSMNDRPSILKSLQNAQRQNTSYDNEPRESTSDTYDNVWLPEPLSSKKFSSPVQESPNTSNFNYNNWKSQFKEVDLDESMDDACSPQDRYVYELKDMSHKVLRVTSFTRKDLEVSPTYPSADEKRKRFRFPSHSTQAILEVPPTTHTRSRSHGSEIDDNFAPANNDRRPNKPRPKSAGVTRSSGNRHAPAMRTTVVPSCDKPAYYPRQSFSLPRNIIQGLDSDGYSSPASSSVSTPPPYKTPRGTDDMGYSPSSKSSEGRKLNQRHALINFVSKKTGRKLKNDSSSSNFHSPLNTNIDKLRESQTPIPEEDDRDVEFRDNHVHNAENHDHVNKSNLSIPTIELFSSKVINDSELPNHNSSLILEEQDEHRDYIEPGNDHDQTPSLTSAERSASLENLTDSGLDLSRASPNDNVDNNEDQLKTLTIDSLASKADLKPPSRKVSKQHRQRYSNSSNSSSGTTISTLSSFSSSSSASIGKFPALGEEMELPASPRLNVSHLNSPRTREPINTGTYRVKRKPPYDKSNQQHNDDDLYRSTKKIALRPTSSLPVDVMTQSDAQSENSHNNFKSSETLLQVRENINKIIEKVKNSTALPDSVKSASVKNAILPPPPSHSLPLDEATEKLLVDFTRQRQAVDALISAPFNSVLDLSKESRSHDNKSTLQVPALRHLDNESSSTDTTRRPSDTSTPPLVGSCGKATCLMDNDSNQVATNQEPGASESNINRHSPSDEFLVHESSYLAVDDHVCNLNSQNQQKNPANNKPNQASSLPLPDTPIFIYSSATSLQEEHPDLTRDILEEDKSLALVLTLINKKTSDYMEGVLSKPSRNIVEKGIRYRNQKSFASDENGSDIRNNNDTRNGLPREKLPASSAYYTTSASKAKILNQMKEKLAGGENPYQDQVSCDEINRKKMELIMSINNKLEDLQSMKGVLANEMKENERLGRQVLKLVEQVCSSKELEKYHIFVQDVDKIINLLLSLSGRLARVENTIQMLSTDADKQEKEVLSQKRKKLNEQHQEAKQLKENIDRRQRAVSDILARILNGEQFADFEHFIEMKSALIMEQRELDDKIKLGREQMNCLRESLPSDWQCNLDKLIEE